MITRENAIRQRSERIRLLKLRDEAEIKYEAALAQLERAKGIFLDAQSELDQFECDVAEFNMTLSERIRASQQEAREAGNCKHEFESISTRCWICGLTRAQCEK